MDKPPPQKIFFLSVLFFSLVLCFSCSEDRITLAASDAKLVFDFETESEKPSVRLSLFAQASSNVRRIESITVRHEDYFWTIEDPVLIQNQERTWAGYMHLAPPPDSGLFPKGLYTFECMDAAGNTAQGRFFVQYGDSIPESLEKFDISGWMHRIAVYSENSELLYFEKPQEKWTDDEKVFSSVKNSDYLRHIYEAGSQICICPRIYKETPERRKNRLQLQEGDSDNKEGGAENAV